MFYFVSGGNVNLFNIGYHALLGQKYYAAGPQSGVYMTPIGGGEGRYYPAGINQFSC